MTQDFLSRMYANQSADAISSTAGALSEGNSVKTLPWQTSNVKSPFFRQISIDPKRWDGLYPYRLLVIDTTKNNAIINGPANAGTNSVEVIIKSVSSPGKATIEFTPIDTQWIFTLPITPQQLTITDQFAINTTATLRGILEEHNGVKFKMISAAGSLGVWAYRNSTTQLPSSPVSPTAVQSLFGGTIQSAQNLSNQFSRVINAATTNHPASKPTTIRPENNPQSSTSTGYYQALALQQFLEQYAEAKKDPENAGWRLVFDIPKQNQSFVVTPMMFDWSQSVAKAMEINYRMQFKAWRRIDITDKTGSTNNTIQPISPGVLQRILSTISEARKLMSASIDLIGAVRSDIETPLTALRETSLFVKDLAGVALTVADLPNQIISDYSSSIKQSMVINKDTIASLTSDSNANQLLKNIGLSSIAGEGLSQAAIKSGQLGQASAHAVSADPTNNIFKSPESNFTLLDQVSVQSLSLSPKQQKAINDSISDSSSYTVDDLKKFRATILNLALQLSNNFGAGSAYYNKIYGRSAPNTRLQPLSLDEYNLLKSLYDTLQSYDILTASTQVDDDQKQTNMEYVAGLAAQSAISFNVPISKVMAPVPYGLTVEGIAARYLGDPQRWLEIVTLNNLKNPYIDETGFAVSLLSNATGRQLNISSVDNLYLGQTITLGSNTQARTSRKIIGIDRLSDFDYLITVDGLPNLDNFTTADKAYLQAYLPGTVNSQQKIFIPSDIAVPNDPNILVPSSVSQDPLVGMSKVDLLLDDSGDVAINNFGDFRLSAGMTNIIQAIKIKIGTVKGSWLLHKEFGAGIRPGTINSDIDIQQIYNILNNAIIQDPRFKGISNLQVRLEGPTLTINMGVSIAGKNGVFPISFDMPL